MTAAGPAPFDSGRPSDPEQVWRDLALLGRSASTAGCPRLLCTCVWTALRVWFTEQPTARTLTDTLTKTAG